MLVRITMEIFLLRRNSTVLIYTEDNKLHIKKVLAAAAVSVVVAVVMKHFLEEFLVVVVGDATSKEFFNPDFYALPRG